MMRIEKSLIYFCFFQFLQIYTEGRIIIDFPANHSRWQVSSKSITLQRLEVHFHVENFRLNHEGYLVIHGEKIDPPYVHHSEATNIIFSDIEAGSHFWTAELYHANGTLVEDSQTVLHIEVVIPQEDCPNWKYVPSESEQKPVIFETLLSIEKKRQYEPIPVCYVTSPASFDGQKKMWLQLLEHLDRKSFSFYVKTYGNILDSPITQALKKIKIPLSGVKLEIDLAELQQHNVTSDKLMQTLRDSLLREIAESGLTIGNTSVIDSVQPPFARVFWQRLTSTLSSCQDGLVIFSNSRGVADEILAYASRLAGAKAILMELANLAPTSLKVDALIAPSYFALYHPSVQTQVQAKHQYVLFTGIDHHVFVPSINTISKATVIIGYVGRLATEKSLGLLIEAAKHLSNSICSMYQCKFRIIGDGKLRHSLQELVHDWSLENMVELLPGIYNENMLVKELQKMDIYVNARFLETLGISPLEAMAVGIPVIGFGSGGMSQYMRDGFNSVVVKEPTPEAFANAIAYLIQNPDKRFYLGYNARKTVKDFFSLNDRLKQYSQIYKRLGKKTQVL